MTGATLAWQLRVGLAFARGGFLRMMAYRVRYLVGVVNYFLYVSVHYYVLWAVKEANPQALAAFRGPADLVTYLAVAWAARAAYYNNLDYLISEQVRSGQLAMDLLRPSAFPWMKFSETAGETFFRMIVMSMPVLALLYAVYYPRLLLPPGAAAAGLFAASLLMSFLLYFALNFLTGMVSVVTLRIQGFLWAKFLMVQLLSGVMLPLAMFPPWLAPVLERSPFAGLGHTPVMLYLGKLAGPAAADALAWQLAWTALLLAACAAGWRLASRRITIQGG